MSRLTTRLCTKTYPPKVDDVSDVEQGKDLVNEYIVGEPSH